MFSFIYYIIILLVLFRRLVCKLNSCWTCSKSFVWGPLIMFQWKIVNRSCVCINWWYCFVYYKTWLKFSVGILLLLVSYLYINNLFIIDGLTFCVIQYKKKNLKPIKKMGMVYNVLDYFYYILSNNYCI